MKNISLYQMMKAEVQYSMKDQQHPLGAEIFPSQRAQSTADYYAKVEPI